MTALKAHEVERFLARPLPERAIFLIYGPDAGLVAERADVLRNQFSGENPDPDDLATIGVTSLQMDELAAEPGRLAREANTPSLFAGTPVIHLRNATRALAPELQHLLDHPPDAPIIIEAGNLVPRDKLRTIVEAARNAWTLPCFPDDEQALSNLIRATFDQAGVTVETGTVHVLSGLLGNDRAITRRELEKLILFANETKYLAIDDVIALCGDNSRIALDRIVDAAGCGHAANLESAVSSAFNSGSDPQQVLGAALRHFLWLRNLRARVDAGAGPGDALKNSFPRPHFSRRSALEQQLRLWSDEALAKATDRIQRATLHSRQNAALSPTIARRALLAICLAAGRR